MNKKLGYVFVIAATLSAFSCKKPATPTPPPPPVEENIAFSIEPDPGTSTVTSTTATYPYTIKLTSKLPSTGIHVDHATQLDSDNSAPSFTRVSSTSATSYSLTTLNLDPGKIYKVTIVLTSQKTASNSLTKTFKVAKK